MLKAKAHKDIEWAFIFDPDLDADWARNYFQEYNNTWPNLRPDLPRPVATPGKELVTLTLRSLTKGQMVRVESIPDGYQKLATICAYGVVSWRGLFDEHGRPIEAKSTQDDLGAKLTAESLEDLCFFGFTDLSLLQIAAHRVLVITR